MPLQRVGVPVRYDDVVRACSGRMAASHRRHQPHGRVPQQHAHLRPGRTPGRTIVIVTAGSFIAPPSMSVGDPDLIAD
jgi:hypothetical protein